MPRETARPARDFARKHFRFGWWSLLCFLSLGVLLESMHGLKIGFYLDVANDTRRLMWTLAHAHGTLLSVIHLVFGMYLTTGPVWRPGALSVASRCLTGAGVLLPAGFFLGGVVIHDGDPGLGILLVPIGAAMLFVAVLFAARSHSPGDAEAP